MVVIKIGFRWVLLVNKMVFWIFKFFLCFLFVILIKSVVFLFIILMSKIKFIIENMFKGWCIKFRVKNVFEKFKGMVIMMIKGFKMDLYNVVKII